MLATPYDPNLHEVTDLPIVHDLRRDTNLSDLITYRNHHTNTWMLAVRSDCGGFLKEIAYIDGNRGLTTTPSREYYKSLLRVLQNRTNYSRMHSSLKQAQRDFWASEHERKYHEKESYQAMGDLINRRQGAKKAEEYLHGTLGSNAVPRIRVGT